MFKKVRGALVAVAPLGLVVGSAQAAVPSGVEAIFTGTATDFGTLLGYGYTLMAVIVGGLILLGLVKKVAKKSAGG